MEYTNFLMEYSYYIFQVLGDERMANPDTVFPFRNTEEVREKVAQERSRLLQNLHRDGTPCDCCKAEVCYIRSILELYMSYTRNRNGIY
jgi:hypothetical protein